VGSAALFVGLVSLGCSGGSGNSTAGLPGPIPGSVALSLVPSRTSGVAPLAVVFDASGTTATGVTNPIHELYYVWDFGDSGSGTWAFGNTFVNSKNFATGPIAAHVFDPAPGSGTQVYTVALNVYDIFGNTAQATQKITVNDPNSTFSATNTICVAATTTPVAGSDGCPTGASVQQQSSWAKILSSHVATNKRVLLKHGDVFTGSANGSLSGGKANGAIGTYDTTYPPTTKAIIRNSGTNIAMIQIGSLGDFKFMDLEFDGESQAKTAVSNSGSSYTTLTFLRLNIHNIGGGLELSLDQSNALATGVVLHDSTLTTLSGGSSEGAHGILVGCPNVSIQGNLFSGTTLPTEHLMRLQFLDRAVVSHNQIDNNADTKEMIALRSPCAASSPCAGQDFSGLGLTGNAAHSRKVMISDNYIEINQYAGLQIGGVSTTDSWVVENVIVERNYWKSVGGTMPIRIDGGPSAYGASLVTVRNELMDVSQAGSGAQISVGQLSTTFPSSINCYNNTISGAGSSSWGSAIDYNTSSTGIIRNNIAFDTGVSSPSVIVNAGSATVGTNSTSGSSGQVKSRPWTANPATTPSQFQLDSTQYADAAGDESVPVFDDYFGNIRNLSNMDLGFHAFTQ
jgi:hypothetical protein